MFIENQGSNVVSLQVSRYGDIPVGEDFVTDGAHPFLIKNNTEERVQVKIVDAEGCAIDTWLDSGWNPEIVYKLIKAPEGLQWGY
ncbi:MAG: hypothetical protein MJZ98_00630 [Paludibacteraceae bacterium]|nr:hypothetical protein [Paludibacteraceae bacterium]